MLTLFSFHFSASALPFDGTGYNDKTVTITLPEGYTVFDIGHIGLWCESISEDFGHVKIPPRSQLNIPPYVEYEEFEVKVSFWWGLK